MLGNKIAEGRTAEIFEYGDNKVLKLYFKEFEADIDLEYQRCKIVSDTDIVTPKVYEKINANNRQGIVFERLDGICLGDAFGKYPFRISEFAKKAALVHAGISSAKNTELPKQNDIFKIRIKQVDCLKSEDKDKIIKYCDTLIESDKICHGDLHVENYIYSNDNLYVIDWLTAYRGHPAGDIARTMLIMNSPVITYDKPFIERMVVKIIVNRYNRRFYKLYKRYANVSDYEVSRFLLPVAAIRLTENIPSERQWLLKIINEELKNL